MRRIFAAVLMVCFVSIQAGVAQPVDPPPPAPTPAAPPTEVVPERLPTPNTLMDGTAVKLRLSETISSADATVGQQIPFEVTEEVMVDGVAVIAKGARALASVTEASRKTSMGRGGKLNVNVDSVRLIDNEKIQLRAVRDGQGGGHVGAMTGAMVATTIVFFPAAPLFLFIHGKDIVIPKGTEVSAFVQGDMKLNMAHFVPAGLAPAVAAAPSTSSLTVESSVPGADIQIDGAFAGNTPSTVSLTPGPHTITVTKKGYADWSRKMNVSGSGVHLNAELEAK